MISWANKEDININYIDWFQDTPIGETVSLILTGDYYWEWQIYIIGYSKYAHAYALFDESRNRNLSQINYRLMLIEVTIYCFDNITKIYKKMKFMFNGKLSIFEVGCNYVNYESLYRKSI